MSLYVSKVPLPHKKGETQMWRTVCQGDSHTASQLTYSQPWELEVLFSLPDTEHRIVTASIGGEGGFKCTFPASGQDGGGVNLQTSCHFTTRVCVWRALVLQTVNLEKKQAQIFPYNFTTRHESLIALTVRDKKKGPLENTSIVYVKNSEIHQTWDFPGWKTSD